MIPDVANSSFRPDNKPLRYLAVNPAVNIVKGRKAIYINVNLQQYIKAITSPLIKHIKISMTEKTDEVVIYLILIAPRESFEVTEETLFSSLSCQ